MRLTSGAVLALSTAVSSPALYKGLVTGELPTDVALTRYLVALVLVWAALSLLAALVGPAAPAALVEGEPAAVEPGRSSVPGAPGTDPTGPAVPAGPAVPTGSAGAPG